MWRLSGMFFFSSMFPQWLHKTDLIKNNNKVKLEVYKSISASLFSFCTQSTIDPRALCDTVHFSAVTSPLPDVVVVVAWGRLCCCEWPSAPHGQIACRVGVGLRGLTSAYPKKLFSVVDTNTPRWCIQNSTVWHLAYSVKTQGGTS